MEKQDVNGWLSKNRILIIITFTINLNLMASSWNTQSKYKLLTWSKCAFDLVAPPNALSSWNGIFSVKYEAMNPKINETTIIARVLNKWLCLLKQRSKEHRSICFCFNWTSSLRETYLLEGGCDTVGQRLVTEDKDISHLDICNLKQKSIILWNDLFFNLF